MTTTHIFQIETWTDTRSNRRDRTYTVAAPDAAEALMRAKYRAFTDTRSNGTIVATIVDVDGNGAPQDCEHADARLHSGWVLRADGGRNCRARCAS